ncbi:hypothetical protein E2C01_084996 [Portunus trituberculatus]|uniref:Uncharacterized protein n=1 Tax=Portunus trituberculatus TaxID=210409 RepID=A0A5B7J5L1_PORTR|nr:hypothetical protein [Portunus trituberculatus]
MDGIKEVIGGEKIDEVVEMTGNSRVTFHCRQHQLTRRSGKVRRVCTEEEEEEEEEEDILPQMFAFK